MNDPVETPDLRWFKILTEYLRRCRIGLPFNPGVLNLGCGNSIKWNYLGVAYFLGINNLGTPRYVGVDLQEDAFSEARKALGELVRFVAGDARRLTVLLQERFHLAVVEHPDLSTSRERPRVWQEIFREAAMLLEPGGGLILTSFWLNDHIPAQVALERAGYSILHSGSNMFPGRMFDRASSGEPLIYDRYILVARPHS